MADAGVLFVSGQKEGKLIEYYAAVYKGEVIEEFTQATKSKFAGKYSRLKETKIEEALESLYNKTKFLKNLPENCEIVFKDGSYNFRDLSTNELVGLVEVIDEYLGFAIFRKGLKTKVMGQQVFNSLIEYLKLNKVSFKGILGIWGKESDNTLVFNQAISRKVSNEKAAFETWTGKRALEQGFDKVKIDKLVPSKPPYTTINVTFYK